MCLHCPSFCPRLVQNAHLALIDSLMSLAAKETVGRVKMAAEAEQMGVGSPWENALLFWVNRVRSRRHGNDVDVIFITGQLYCLFNPDLMKNVTHSRSW